MKYMYDVDTYIYKVTSEEFLYICLSCYIKFYCYQHNNERDAILTKYSLHYTHVFQIFLWEYDYCLNCKQISCI